MTITIAIKTEKGILIATDSVELVQSEYIISDDLNNFLSQHGVDITDTIDNTKDVEVKFQVKELRKFFTERAKLTNNKLRYTENHKKIYKLSDFVAIMFSGSVDFGKFSIEQILPEIEEEIAKLQDKNIDEISTIVESIISKYYNSPDNINNQHFKYIVCGYNQKTDKFEIYTISKIRDDVDLTKFVCKKSNLSGNWIVTGGCYDNLLDCFVNKMNTDRRINPNQLENLNIENAFDLAKSISDLIIVIERVYNSIISVGGNLNFAFINKNGFRFIDNKSDLLNNIDR